MAVKNKSLFISIIKNKEVSNTYKQKAKEINQCISVKEWNLVESEKDVEGLMSTAWGFHDGIIEKVIHNKESESVEVSFSGCWGSKIVLCFKFELRFSFQERFDGFDGFIMDSNIFFENGFVYWVDSCEIQSEKDLKEDTTYFRAKALFWKQETEYYDD